MKYIDDFPVQKVAEALRRIEWSPKAKALVYALATAPNRSMSRIELARTVGSESAQSCNAVLGMFGRKLAMELDSRLAETWKPASGPQGDWVMFMNWGPGRWTEAGPSEQDTWVFLMRETLARALDTIGFAPFKELDDEAAEVLAESYGLNVPDDDYGNGITDPLADIEAAAEELSHLSNTERVSVIMSRVGQGVFRQRLLDAWERRCAVTGSRFLPALVASHIKPWSMSTNEERLDPDNGLLLVGTLDRLFDGGFITFEADGRIRISPSIPEDEYASLQLSPTMRLRHLPARSLPFLEQHRMTSSSKKWRRTAAEEDFLS